MLQSEPLKLALMAWKFTAPMAIWFSSSLRQMPIRAQMNMVVQLKTAPALPSKWPRPSRLKSGLNAPASACRRSTQLVIWLKARKLAFITDVPGLLRDASDDESIMSTLRIGEVEELIAKGVIDGGMLPKVQSGVEALRAGVRKIHMIDGRMPHSLLLEIFTDKGVGTEIVWDEQN